MQFGKKTRSAQYNCSGLGLGLYASKRILDKISGKIDVVSKGKHLGCIACFSIPLSLVVTHDFSPRNMARVLLFPTFEQAKQG